MYIVAQIIGFVAVIVYLLSYQMKERKNIIIVNTAASILYVIQYTLLGAYEGAITDVFATVSAISANHKEKPLIKRFAYVILGAINIAIITTGIILYKNVYSLLPVAGTVLQTSALWITKEKQIRIVSVLGTPFWIVYNFYCEAYGPAIGSIFSMISILVAIYRYDIRKKKQ